MPHETQPDYDPIPQPILRTPDGIVENIYAIEGTQDNIQLAQGGTPDLASQDTTSEYLIDRLKGEPATYRTRVVFTPTERKFPKLSRTDGGYEPVTRSRWGEWIITPKEAAAVMLASAAVFNLVGNYDTIEDAGDWIGHKIYRVFDPVHDVTTHQPYSISQPGKIKNISMTTGLHNEAGANQVDPASVRPFVDQVKSAERAGGSLVQVVVTGRSSDEWLRDSDLGVADMNNEKLGAARAQAAVRELSKEGLTIPVDKLKVDSVEHVLTQQQVAELKKDAAANGYSDVSSAIRAVDAHQTVPASLASKIKQLFTGKEIRGVTLRAAILQHGKDIVINKTRTITVPGKDNAPGVPEPGWKWFIPMIPLRRRERYESLAWKRRWQLKRAETVMRPIVLHERQDQAWVRVRAEAVKEDQTLVDAPWAYTRKYEHLLRDDRIADMLRVDFNNPKGEAKSLRVMFVDKAPAQETIDEFTRLLTKFAAMENGKLGDRVSGIFVYPTENSGREHGDPKRIAMGIDKQHESHVLGTYTYPFGLVEMHMPHTWDPEELEELFRSYMGPSWVIAHEVAGHGTDVSDETLRLRKIVGRGISNAHIIEGEPRARKMRTVSSLLRHLPRRPAEVHPIEFDISYPVLDNAGNVVTMRARVADNDPRLAHASASRIVGHEVTQYAGESDAEHYAETAAAVTTGITVPYGEAHVTVPALLTDNRGAAAFATGYSPDAQAQKVFTASVGGVSGSLPVAFERTPEVSVSHIHPANDAMLQKHYVRARRSATLLPHEMVAILAQTSERQRG